MGQAAARRRAGAGPGAGGPGAGGVARPAAAGRPRRRAAAAARAAARPARDRRHRTLVGGRDPVGGEAIALQARRRPRTRRAQAPIGCDRGHAGRGAGPLRAGRAAADPRQAADASARAPARGRALPSLRRAAALGVLRGLRHRLLPALPDGRACAQGPAAVAAAALTASARGAERPLPLRPCVPSCRSRPRRCPRHRRQIRFHAMALKVVGVGLGRTGTNSLKLALEQLLGGPCYHMFELIAHPQQVPLWERALRGEKVDWDSLFAGYSATVDWPGCAFWRDLAAANPDAPVLL